MPNGGTRAAGLRRAADPRVVGGIVVMAGSAYLGLLALDAGQDAVLVAVAARDLPAGIELHADDVTMQEVAGADPQHYFDQRGQLPAGSLAFPVAKGELLPRSAVSDESGRLRLVAVPIEAERLPPNIQRGAVVDVWAEGADTAVLQGASVSSVSDPDQWAGASSTVVLAVDAEAVPGLLAATRAGAVDITGYQGTS